MSDGALETAVEQKPDPAAEPSFEQFSKDRKAGKVDATAGGDEVSPGGNQWDPKQNKFVNPVRDDQGRFAKVRESLEKSQQKSTYVRAVLEGAIEPDETTMDADTWAAARNAQIERGTNKITAPNFSTEKTDAEKAGTATSTETTTKQPQLSPEDVRHIEAHDSMLANFAAKVAVDTETRTALDGLKTAVTQGGMPEVAMAYLGHCIADVQNPHEVFLALGRNPAAAVMYAQLGPNGMRRAVLELSRELAQNSRLTAPAPDKKPEPTPKPRPPQIVGGRATATAFDVTDEKLDADEWARQRNDQLAKRGRR